MSAVLLFFFWVAACALVGFAGRHRTLGFWGYFVLSLGLSPPLVGGLLLLTASTRKRPCTEVDG
jgi:hypothetical protein